MNDINRNAFARLIGTDRAIRESPNVIDCRSFFAERADDVRLSRQYRKPQGPKGRN